MFISLHVIVIIKIRVHNIILRYIIETEIITINLKSVKNNDVVSFLILVGFFFIIVNSH